MTYSGVVAGIAATLAVGAVAIEGLLPGGGFCAGLLEFSFLLVLGDLSCCCCCCCCFCCCLHLARRFLNQTFKNNVYYLLLLIIATTKNSNLLALFLYIIMCFKREGEKMPRHASIVLLAGDKTERETKGR